MNLVRSVLIVDDALARRVAQGRSLGPVLATAVAVLVVGCAAYGAAMGSWRSPLQGLSAGLKLPGMFLATAALTAALDVVLCGLLRARVRPLQALTASVLAMAILGAVLGSLAPVAFLLSLQVAPPQGAASIPTSHWLLTAHVLVMGAVGIVAVSRLRGLLDALIDDAAVSRRVLWAWIATHGVVGAQLSWVLRPFVGNPSLPVRVFREDAWHGNFFETVVDMTVARMGIAGPIVASLVLLVVTALVAAHLDPAVASFEVLGDHVAVTREGATSPFRIPFSAVRSVAVSGATVQVDWVQPGSLERSTLRLPCADACEGQALSERLQWAMHAGDAYRAPS